MEEEPDIARIGRLIGDPSRANMLTALMSGKALTASELANEAAITQQTASSHLGKLEYGGLIRLRKQGRHKYFSLANEDVAHALEVLMGVAAGAGHLRTRTGPKDEALRQARVCYNHLAGVMATRLFDHMVTSGHLAITGDGLSLAPSGEDFVRSIGIDLASLQVGRSPLCKECLDWSERRSHLAGSLGRAFLYRIEELKWAKRDMTSRALRFTRSGTDSFEKLIATMHQGRPDS